MKKIIVYPFTYEHRELIIYDYLINNFKLIGAIVLNDSDEKSLKNELNGFSVEKITCNFDTYLNECDTVLFLDTENQYVTKEHYMSKLAMAHKANKEILFTNKCAHFSGETYIENAFMLNGKEEKNVPNATIEKYIKNIDIPAIGVMGIGKYCNKLCCELVLYSYFKSKGYNVVYIGSKDYVPLFGGKIFPDFVNDKNFSVTDRIIKLNHYLFELSISEKADIFVLGMPGGIMPLNNKILNNFGEIPFIISNAIRLDIGILCSYYYERLTGEYIESYSNYCKYKLNCDINFINISNSSYRFNLDSQESVLEYLHYKNEMANNVAIENNDQKIWSFNILNEKSKKMMLEKIYNDLTSGVSAF